MSSENEKRDCNHCSSEGTCHDRLAGLLRVEGGRLTSERRSLLRITCNILKHFTPPELASLLKAEGHEVSLSTVYRNLSLLIQAGIIRRTDYDESGHAAGARYEHIWGRQHHDHLKCSRCGREVDFFYPAIDVLQEAVAREHGFKLERHNLELVGICPDCLNGK